jgi:hypothetical protein
MLTNKQLKQIEDAGIDEQQIASQLKAFKEGFLYANLERPATVGDGIIQASDQEIEKWTVLYDEYAKSASIVKFVPASGAATRMFKGLFEYLENAENNPDAESTINNLKKFAFYNLLKDKLSKEGINVSEADKSVIIRKIIDPSGLNFSNLPKGLLQFHSYPDGPRTAVEEHVVEGLLYANSKGQANLHFTISPEHEKLLVAEFEAIKKKYETLQKVKLDISYSFQKKSTDTIAVTLNNELVTDSNGNLVFRPGGHGALLENLNDIDADIIFIKNIDNVVPDYLKPLTTKYKKALAGLLVQIKQQIGDILGYLEWSDSYTENKKHDIADFINKYLGIKIPVELDNTIFAGYIKSKIDKPIRICGMVKNSGEPGGGPFWALNRKGEPALQIIESSQVDPKDQKQQEILNSATHFNPVDLVCFTKDFNGHKFNLLKYRDPNSGFISYKTIEGKKIKAQELPGLWNGSMAQWITLFVEVPLETFNPVKTIADLLRKEHQPKN